MPNFAKLTFRDLETLVENSSFTHVYVSVLGRKLLKLLSYGRGLSDSGWTEEIAGRYRTLRGPGGIPEQISEYFDKNGKKHIGEKDAVIDIIQVFRDDLSRETIAKYIIPPRTVHRDARGRISRETALEILELWDGGRKTLDLIAAEFGLSKQTVSRLFRKVKPATSLYRGRKRHIDYTRYPGIDAEEVVRLKLSGLTFVQIAAQVGSTKSVVWRVFRAKCPRASLRNHGRRRVDPRNHPRINGAEVVRMIDEERKTIKLVAVSVGACRVTVMMIYHALRPNVDLRKRKRGGGSAQ